MKPQETGWSFDENDPRSPTDEQWLAMTAEARAEVVMMLPSDPLPLQVLPEGDRHRSEVISTEEALRNWYRKRGRSAYGDLAQLPQRLQRVGKL